jgi:ABC-type branched-subunit amino acid transport system ATPase component/ABC-type branched-subunit amino acid transport system substrate-binding protein
MTTTATRRALGAAATFLVAVLAAAACGSPQETASGGGGETSGTPVKVGLVYSQSGPLATYGKQYIEGFRAGLSYATGGTNRVGDRPVEVTEVDDAGDPAKGVSAAKDLIGKGIKIIAGSTASGVALQVAPLATQNKVLFISGPAATDGITGVNKYTFRSGRQSYQDVLDAKSFIGEASGKKVVVFAQDSAFGKSNEAAVTAVIGGAGATVSSVLAPASATDFTPFASQLKSAKPDLLFVAWAGTTAPAMWQTLDQQGILASTTVVTGLDIRASWPTFGAAGTLALLRRRQRHRGGQGSQGGDPRRHARPVPPRRLHRGADGRTGRAGGRRRRRQDGHRAGRLELRRGQGQADHPSRRPRAAPADVPGDPGWQRGPDDGDADQDPDPGGHRTARGADEGLSVLSTHGLTWRVGEVAIVDNVDLDLAPGEFVGVIGPNGAGKTSLFNLISGLRRPTAGTVRLGDVDVTRLAPHQRARRGLGRTFQSSSVFGSLTVRENVRLAAQAHRGGSLALWRRASADRPVARAADAALDRVGLADRGDALAGTLAHGEKRKLEIALLLAGEPSVMLLDEPMAGVSAEDVPDLVAVIRSVVADTDRAVLMVEHHMDVVLELADRVAVMHHGALLACDAPDAVMANATVQSAYLGEAL